MPFLDPTWQFDSTSFVVGALAATIFFAVLYLLRDSIQSLRTGVAERASEARERMTMGSDARYRQDLVAAFQKHHLAGSIIALDDILVPPRFLLEAPMPVPGEDEHEPDITSVVPTSPDYPELSALFQAPCRSLRDLARSESDLLITGRPGSGRTTALAALAIHAAHQETEFFPEPVLPIFVHAGNLPLTDGASDHPERALLEAIPAALPEMPGGVPQRNLQRALADGEALVLLDGWDDLPAAERKHVVDWLRALREARPSARIIAAGPIIGYKPLLELGLVPVVMGGWTDEDYRRLVRRWVPAWEALLAARRRRRADDVDPALVAGWLSGGTGGRLPYEITLRIWGGLAGDVEGPRPVDWFASYLHRKGIGGEVTLALETAAVDILTGGKVGLARSEIVKRINESVPYALNVSRQDPADAVDQLARPGGLLAKRGGSLFAPSHPVTLGYLAARAFTNTSAPDPLVQHHADPAWQVALQPFAALGNASPIVTKLRNGSNGDLRMGLLRAARWLADAPSNAGWRNDVLRDIAQLVMSPDAPADVRGRALCAMVAARDDHVGKFLQRGLTSDDPLVRQFTAVGLGAIRDNSSVQALSDLMKDGDLYVRWAAALALAVIGDLPALEALGTWLLEGDEHQRLAAGQVLALHPSEGHPMLKDAIEDQDTTVRRAAVLGLRRIGAEDWVLQLLQQAFIDDPQWIVKSAAEDATQHLNANQPQVVAGIREPARLDWLVKWAAQQGSSVPADAEGGRRALLKALQDDDDEIQIAAAHYLGAAGAEEAIPALRQAARSGSSAVREAAQQALARIAWAAGDSVRS